MRRSGQDRARAVLDDEHRAKFFIAVVSERGGRTVPGKEPALQGLGGHFCQNLPCVAAGTKCRALRKVPAEFCDQMSGKKDSIR
jgi:hypothetical protein